MFPLKKTTVLLSVETYRKKLSPLYWTIWCTVSDVKVSRKKSNYNKYSLKTLEGFFFWFSKANPFKQGRGSRVPYSQAVPFINRPFQLASRLSVESLAATLNILLLYSYILQKKTVTIIKQGVSQRNHLPFHTYSL